MIGVTIGVGDYRSLAERAAASMAQHTGLQCIVLDDEHYRRAGLENEPASLLKLWLWDFVDEEDVLLFDADTICLRPWNPAAFRDGPAVVAVRDWIWRAGIQAEAASVAVPIEEYFLGCLLVLNRPSHREMLHLARDIYPQTSKRLLEQTALNAARSRLGVPLRLLDRRYSWSLFGRGNLQGEAAVITGHYNDSDLRANFAAVCGTSSVGEVDEPAFERLGDRYYRYARIGHEERPLLLRRDGTIGNGGGDAERFWFVRQSDGQRTLVIGSETMVTCELRQGADGVWRGRWVDYERMPIELAPHRAQVLLDLLGDRQRPLCGAEIGVFEGHTAAVLLRELPQLRLWMVDRWAAPRPGERYWQDPYMRGVPQAQMDLALHKALNATEFARERRVVMIADLAVAAAGMADGMLDFVFCDADHSAEGTAGLTEGCEAQFIGCMCCMINILDAAITMWPPTPDPVLEGFRIALTLILNLLDCFCDIANVVIAMCKEEETPGECTSLGTFFFSILSCAFDAMSALVTYNPAEAILLLIAQLTGGVAGNVTLGEFNGCHSCSLFLAHAIQGDFNEWWNNGCLSTLANGPKR